MTGIFERTGFENFFFKKGSYYPEQRDWEEQYGKNRNFILIPKLWSF